MNSDHGDITLGSEMGDGVQSIYARNLAMLSRFWTTNSLNIAIRIKANMDRNRLVKSFYATDVSLPNGVNLTDAGYGNKMLAGSPISGTMLLGVIAPNAASPSTSRDGIITLDCDYRPAADVTRTRPAPVQNVNISNVTVGNVTTGNLTGSCFQVIVAQGPVVFDYNSPLPVSAIPPITGVTISNCNFGTPIVAGLVSVTTSRPLYAYNVHDIALQNVMTAGQALNTTATDAR